MPKDRWTEYETEKLKSMAGTYTTREIAEALGRRVSAIRLRAHRLNLSLAKRNVVWTDRELRTLKRLSKRYSAEYIAKSIPDKTVKDIKQQSVKMGIKLTNHRWTKKEVELLEMWAGEKPLELIAQEINRPVDSIHQKARKLNISLKPEIDYYSAEQIGDILQIHPTTICRWIKKGKLQASQCNPGIKSSVYRITRKSFKDFYETYKDLMPRLKAIDPERVEYLIYG